MRYKGPEGFARFASIFNNLAISAFVSAFVSLALSGGFVFIEWLRTVVIAFALGYVAGDLMPLMDWGGKLSNALHVKNKVGVYLITGALIGIVCSAILIFFILFINTILESSIATIMATFIRAWPVIALATTLVTWVFMAPCMKLAGKLSGFDPDAGQEQAAQASAEAPMQA